MRKSFEDLTGQKFGELTVIAFDRRENNRTYWKCKCSCGNEIITRADSLKSGGSSCGCIGRKHLSEFMKKLGKTRTVHGLYKSRIYKIYFNMKDRCLNPNTSAYHNYGARGITVCEEWLADIENFAKWANENGYKDNLTLDRINVNGNYEPNNCRWVTMKTQANNKRNNRLITYNGETHNVTEWGEIYGIRPALLRQRMDRDGKPFELAVMK